MYVRCTLFVWKRLNAQNPELFQIAITNYQAKSQTALNYGRAEFVSSLHSPVTDNPADNQSTSGWDLSQWVVGEVSEWENV